MTCLPLRQRQSNATQRKANAENVAFTRKSEALFHLPAKDDASCVEAFIMSMVDEAVESVDKARWNASEHLAS